MRILYFVCVRVYVCVSGQNLTNQFVNWQLGIFNLITFRVARTLTVSNILYISVLINEKRVNKEGVVVQLGMITICRR